MAPEYNPPPAWPRPPTGWEPDSRWRPDATWPSPPPGWQVWPGEQPDVDPDPFRVFISYRRNDCQPQANGLADGLRSRVSEARVFMDVDAMPPGVDFVEHIRREIEQCELVMVLIGDNWLDPRPGSDVRRIDEPDDIVRLEVECALAAGDTRVLPVLVEGERMPDRHLLPESIQRLAQLNAVELSDDRWSDDIRRLAGIVDDMRRAHDARLEAEGSLRLQDVDGVAVVEAIRQLGTFSTTELARHPEMVRAHLPLQGLRSYRELVGRYLATNAAGLGLVRAGSGTRLDGQLWERRGALPDANRRAETDGAHGTGATHGVPPRRDVPRRDPRRPGDDLLPPPPPVAPRRGNTLLAWLLAVVPLVTCGVLAVVPFLYAASVRPSGRPVRSAVLQGWTAELVGVVGWVIVIIASSSGSAAVWGTVLLWSSVLWGLGFGVKSAATMKSLST